MGELSYRRQLTTDEGPHLLADQGHHRAGTRCPCWIISQTEAPSDGNLMISHSLGLLAMRIIDVCMMLVVVLLRRGRWIVLKLALHVLQVRL